MRSRDLTLALIFYVLTFLCSPIIALQQVSQDIVPTSPPQSNTDVQGTPGWSKPIFIGRSKTMVYNIDANGNTKVHIWNAQKLETYRTLRDGDGKPAMIGYYKFDPYTGTTHQASTPLSLSPLRSVTFRGAVDPHAAWTEVPSAKRDLGNGRTQQVHIDKVGNTRITLLGTDAQGRREEFRDPYGALVGIATQIAKGRMSYENVADIETLVDKA